MNPVVNIIAIIVMVISCLTTALFVIFGIYELIMARGRKKTAQETAYSSEL